MYKSIINALASCCVRSQTVCSVCLPRHHLRGMLLLSTELCLFRRQSLFTWSCGHLNTLPLFRTPSVIATGRFGSSDGVSTELRRCYTVQTVNDKLCRSAGSEQEKATVCYPSQSADNASVHDVQSHSSDSIATTAGPQEIRSDRADAVQLTVGTSIPQISQNDTSRKIGLIQRFRLMYKQYGAVLVSVHVATSSVWVSLFYFATVSGVDVVPLLRWLGASDTVVSPFLVPGVGSAAVIYLMYKLASPARYAVTVAGTQLAVRLLRRRGYLRVPETPSGKPDPLHAMVSDGRAKVKNKMEDLRGDMNELKGRVRQMHGQLSSQRSASHQEKL